MDILSTSSINQLVQSYKQTEVQNRLQPLNDKKEKYQNLYSAWDGLYSKLNDLKSVLSSMKDTSSSSIFNSKAATSSDTDYVTVSASNSASVGSHTISVSQLAKTDIAVGKRLTADDTATIASGDHSILFKSGDTIRSIDFEITADELADSDTNTNQAIMEKIANEINTAKSVSSDVVTSASTVTDSGSFTFTYNDTDYTINYNYSGDTNSDALDDIATQINAAVGSDIAKRVTVGTESSLQITPTDSSYQVSTSNDTGSILSTLNLDMSSVSATTSNATASAFSPTSDTIKFSFTAKSSGEDNALSFASTAALTFLDPDNTLTAARSVISGDDSEPAGWLYDSTSLDANLKFNGISVVRSSNSFSDLVDGLTIKLKDTTASNVTLTVENDDSTIKTNVEQFISSFNDAYTYIKNRNVSDELTRGVFTGDTSANSIMSYLRTNVLNGFGVTEGTVGYVNEGELKYMSQLGITFDTATGLSLTDSSKLADWIDEDPDKVLEFFTNDTGSDTVSVNDGIAVRLFKTIEDYLGADGTISKIKNSYNDNISFYSDRIESMSDRIDQSAATLRGQYEQLQMQLSALLSSQSSFNAFSQGTYY